MKHGTLIAFFCIVSILTPVIASASPSPAELGRQHAGRADIFDPDHHTPYRFQMKSNWTPEIRVNVGQGGSIPRGNGKFAVYENRIFFLKTAPERIFPSLDVPNTFRNNPEIQLSELKLESDKVKTFKIEVIKSGIMASVRVSCSARAESSGPFPSTDSRYLRYQLVLSQCYLNGKDVLIDKAWLTFDVHQFDGTKDSAKDRAGLQVRSLYLSNIVKVDGRFKDITLSTTQLHDLSVLITDQVLLGVFNRLGHPVEKSYLWTNQP